MHRGQASRMISHEEMDTVLFIDHGGAHKKCDQINRQVMSLFMPFFPGYIFKVAKSHSFETVYCFD